MVEGAFEVQVQVMGIREGNSKRFKKRVHNDLLISQLKHLLGSPCINFFCDKMLNVLHIVL
jgi:tetrahydromethanopterin S-methyltransferase subunit E